MSCVRAVSRPAGMSENFSHLFKRAVSPGQSNKPPRSARHLHFAFMHRIHDNLNSSQFQYI